MALRVLYLTIDSDFKIERASNLSDKNPVEVSGTTVVHWLEYMTFTHETGVQFLAEEPCYRERPRRFTSLDIFHASHSFGVSRIRRSGHVGSEGRSASMQIAFQA